MNLRLPARIGAFACLGVAIAMAALALRDPPRAGEASPSSREATMVADPLDARLLRCQQAGEAAGSDPDCLAAWAENRRRFLGLGRARPAEPTPSPAMNLVAESSAPPAGSTPAGAQPREH